MLKMSANEKSDSISFNGPNKSRYHELEQKVIEYYVHEKRSEGLLTTREVIWMKSRVCNNRTHGRYGDESECRTGWCMQMMKRGLMLWCKTTLAQHIRAEYAEKHISFQRYVINLQKQQ